MRDLDPGYVTWLIERNAEARRFDAAESLAQQMIRTIDATPAGFDAERRAGVLLAYARIAEVRQEFAKARAQYERIAAASEFAGSRAQLIGQLRMANIDRVTEQYDQAIIQLDKLTHEEDMMVQAEAYFGLAQLYHDQEQLAEASENLEEVFTRSPSHAAARILKGRIDLGMKRLEEATLVKVGIAGDRKIIVPGRPLRVELEDRNLAVAGAAESIQVRVWTSQGDDEIFSLYPRGDSRTRFEGEIASEVAPMAVGDSVLQLLGSDTVWFSYSTGLEAKPSQEQPAGELTVVTDAELYASSGEILSKEQLEEQQIEESIRRQLQMNAGYEERLALSTRRPSDEVKPGNPVNVRVVDLDQSSTAAPDRLIVRVAAASGDSLEQVALVETDTHSGVFEGSFTTSAGQAMAYASDSQEGRDPNFAISSGDYPAWVALPDNQKPKTFSVDLNDNVSLGKMRILADTPGRKLKSFLLQTSLNGRDFATIGSWPRKFEAWDGGLRAEVVGLPTGKAPATIREYQTQLDTGYLTAGTGRAVLPIDSMAVNFPTLRGLATKGVRLRQNDWTLGRVSGYIDIERPQLRTFEIRMTDEDSATTCILVIDGEPAERGTLDRRRLSRGVHRIDIYFASPASEKGGFVLHMTDPENPRLRPASADAFDPAKHPAIVEAAKAPTARIDSDQTGQVFDVTFSAQAQARILRLLIADYETDAPSISEITLLNGKGEKVLPASEDFMKLRQNSTLEITPGDEITISYRDSRSLTKSTESREAYMHATYSDAEVSAAFIKADYESGGERKIEYIPLRRFVPGDAVKVFIKDPDGDVSDEADVLEFDAMTSDGTRVSLRARESDRHSGVFMGDVFPVSGEPKRDTELQVREGDDLTISYLDQENTDPGIAWTRQFLVEQVWHTTPELRVFAAVTSAADGSGMTDDGLAPEQRVLEFTPVERMVTLKRPEAPAGVDEVTPVLVDGPLIVELTYPSIAKSPASEAELFIQTEAGRQLHQANIGGVGDTDAMPFDVNVPGTIRMTRVPEEAAAGDTPPGYRSPLIEGNPYAAEPVDEGRFTFVVPMEMATPPQKSLAFEVDEEKQRGRLEEPKLAIRGGDRVYVGYRYTNEAGEVTWIQQKVQLTSDPFFHVMDRRYQLQISETHIGETLYFRVIDKKFDATDEKDQLTVKLSATSGAAMDVDVIETFPHSGIFRGYVRLAYRGETLGATEQNVFQVDYGDVVTAVYQRDGETVTREIDVFKGADGHVLPFTKRFADPEKAVQTQFTIAEAYFELAKRHRELATAAKDDPARQRQLESLVRREIAQGKKLLEEALRDFPNTESRAQAEYLLANLSYEFANDANNDQTKRRHNLEAINRFSDIVARFPDSPYAPRSQFKKALVLEQMGEIDKACEEYVKLSYRYPENELVAETIARLGQYFLTKGKDFETSAAAAADDPVEAEKIRLRSRDMFRTAAEVFGRLGVRFPDHGLAQKTKVLSGQCYMRAEDFKKAIEVFTDIFESEGANPQLASESMYWAGDCYMRLMSYTDAYRTFKKLTWDYPESQWARFARGRLTDDHLLSAAEQDVEN